MIAFVDWDSTTLSLTLRGNYYESILMVNVDDSASTTLSMTLLEKLTLRQTYRNIYSQTTIGCFFVFTVHV